MFTVKLNGKDVNYTDPISRCLTREGMFVLPERKGLSFAATYHYNSPSDWMRFSLTPDDWYSIYRYRKPGTYRLMFDGFIINDLKYKYFLRSLTGETELEL